MMCGRDGSLRDTLHQGRLAGRLPALKTMPPLRSKVPADFGERKGPSGQAWVHCALTHVGTLQDCCILKGVDTFNGPVLESVSKWTFAPLEIAGTPGRPVYTDLLIAVEWKL